MERLVNKMTIFIKARQSKIDTFRTELFDQDQELFLDAKLYRSFALNNGDWKIDRQAIWRYQQKQFAIFKHRSYILVDSEFKKRKIFVFKKNRLGLILI